MVDKFVDSNGKVVLEINDNNEEKLDPTLLLKEIDQTEFVQCKDCNHGEINVFKDKSMDGCKKCGGSNLKKYRRIMGKVQEIGEGNND